MFSSLGGEVEALIDNAIELSWFMRGAVPYEEMLRRTPGERQRMGKFISKRLEKESKRMTPIY
jgi:hypothetical protein